MTSAPGEPRSEEAPAQDVLLLLVENHRRFLGFLKSKVGSDAVAEEILQAAFVKGVESSKSIRDEESAVAWFYRVLRNAVIDHYRHQGAEDRALAQFAAEMPEDASGADDEIIGSVCGCIRELLSTMRSEDGDLIRRVDLDDAAIVAVAAERGITAGSARVRLHRARQALRRRVEQSCGTCATHGCLNCTCGAGTASACGV